MTCNDQPSPAKKPTHRCSLEDLREALRDPSVFPDPGEDVEVRETHISVLFLTGEFVYKVKKPIRTDFLDYRSLQQRQLFCQQEVRLDQRYADGLYVGVVPICQVDGRFQVEGNGEPVEYAVKMRRFPQEALLSRRLEAGEYSTGEVRQLADEVARFHLAAEQCDAEFARGWPDFVTGNLTEMVQRIEPTLDERQRGLLQPVRQWSDAFLQEYRPYFAQRAAKGFVRECHGDLHVENVLRWHGRWVPFDGIEFNERLRLIDVMADVAFLVMDFAARGGWHWSHSFLNAYLEVTGDYRQLALMKWFEVYRATVRVLVASIRLQQPGLSAEERGGTEADLQSHLELAHRYTQPSRPRLWITHGLSGSGKTTVSERWVQYGGDQHVGTIRLRSDIERKRMMNQLETPLVRPDTLYHDRTTKLTYERLYDLAGALLRAGRSVVVDATFLRRADRSVFAAMADRYGVPFGIIDCDANMATLRQRLTDRQRRGTDASDADTSVLEAQTHMLEPLTDEERQCVVTEPASSTPASSTPACDDTA